MSIKGPLRSRHGRDAVGDDAVANPCISRFGQHTSRDKLILRRVGSPINNAPGVGSAHARQLRQRCRRSCVDVEQFRACGGGGVRTLRLRWRGGPEGRMGAIRNDKQDRQHRLYGKERGHPLANNRKRLAGHMLSQAGSVMWALVPGSGRIAHKLRTLGAPKKGAAPCCKPCVSFPPVPPGICARSWLLRSCL